jgi:proteasome lid subunit RPN8/RPN11
MFVCAIVREVLDLLLEMGRASFPDEFIVMLGTERNMITTVYPIAGTMVTNKSAIIFRDMIPLGMQIAGTAHSHPNGVLLPSNADLQTFAETGQCHIIVGDPFEANSWLCFDRDGRERSLEVVSA